MPGLASEVLAAMPLLGFDFGREQDMTCALKFTMSVSLNDTFCASLDDPSASVENALL